jgi:hypothetical protein
MRISPRHRRFGLASAVLVTLLTVFPITSARAAADADDNVAAAQLFSRADQWSRASELAGAGRVEAAPHHAPGARRSHG